jgi:beta-glucosidase-like glycosyl hydrolase
MRRILGFALLSILFSATAAQNSQTFYLATSARAGNIQLPRGTGAAESWDKTPLAISALVVQEIRAQGSNMTSRGGVELAHEPRNGHGFEYAGDDPLLSGTVVGTLMSANRLGTLLTTSSIM